MHHTPVIVALLMVRDGVDVLRAHVLHHLSLGIDRYEVVDNRSSDGTTDLLDELAREVPLTWRSDPGPFVQGEIVTRLAREAHGAGADWVVPLDVDEFLTCQGDLPALLAQTDAGALKMNVVNFVAARERRERDPRSLLSMTMRVRRPVRNTPRAQRRMHAKRLSFLQIAFPPKHVVRASPTVEIATGNHRVRGATGPVATTRKLTMLHAPLRCRADLELKAEAGRRVEARPHRPNEGWHARRWARLDEAGELEREWDALSHRDGCLDVYGKRRRLVTDTRLRDVAAPWIE